MWGLEDSAGIEPARIGLTSRRSYRLSYESNTIWSDDTARSVGQGMTPHFANAPPHAARPSLPRRRSSGSGRSRTFGAPKSTWFTATPGPLPDYQPKKSSTGLPARGRREPLSRWPSAREQTRFGLKVESSARSRPPARGERRAVRPSASESARREPIRDAGCAGEGSCSAFHWHSQAGVGFAHCTSPSTTMMASTAARKAVAS